MGDAWCTADPMKKSEPGSETVGREVEGGGMNGREASQRRFRVRLGVRKKKKKRFVRVLADPSSVDDIIRAFVVVGASGRFA